MKTYVDPKTCMQILVMALFVIVTVLALNWVLAKQTIEYPYNGTLLTI